MAHHYWGTPGGGQLVCASVAYGFDRLGLPPALSGTFRFDPGKYIQWYGIDIAKYPTYTLPIDAKAFGLWARLFVWLPAKKAVKRLKPRLVFTDEITYKPIGRGDYMLVEYIHFPFEVFIDPKFKGTGLAYGEDPYITERYRKFPLSLYWKIYQKLLPYVARDNPFRWADVVLANSRWTAGVAKMVYGEAPRVLNPPIPPTTEVVQKPKTFDERKPAVVMLGRFSQEKRYHWVVTELAPKLARELPEVEIHIYGSATTPTLRQYYQHVRKLAEKAGVAKHVFFTPNAPRQEINKAMDDARAFLHATINEHWGIVAVEAMARGLPIVIHKSGGVWTDVAEQGERGLGYTTAEEAVEQIAKLMTDAKLWRQLSQKGMEKARELTLEKFVENLAKALNLPEKT